ncbi:hypothetical protein [Klebsiella variicola]|uniref:hypothetical protein n=1 Tax=Klebsiella variicola TaxID=244366 RepID=UPI000E2BB2F0|nr:hypothetical protein [Klebsiella variicola]SXF48151.1 Uncharacterised protein [Klebsiella variicola]
MTDITELAQLRTELSNPAVGSKDHLRKIALSLVEAQEKALQRIEELESDLSEWTDCKHDGATYYDMSGQERCGRCGADV